MDRDRRVFDRVKHFDERSRNFRAVEGIEQEPLRNRFWHCRCWNDQGFEGACVGFAWSHELCAQPVKFPTDANFAQAIYHRAQQIDYWPGEDYEGTSVLAGVKAVQEILGEHNLPLISEYRWAFGLEDVVRTIGYKGPVVFGIDWYYSMYDPDENGFVSPRGDLAGGHAILGRAVNLKFIDPLGPKNFSNLDLDTSFIRLRNSWGITWGINGDCRISLRDMDKLLKDGGEACVPVVRNL